MPTYPKHRRVAIATVATVAVLADQTSKTLAGRWQPAFLVPVRNHGLSLEVVSAGRWVEVGAMLTGLVVAAILLDRLVSAARVPAWAAGLVVGGAGSNLADRAVLGSVRDFLPVAHLVVVNVADLAVVVGLAACYWMRATARPATG